MQIVICIRSVLRRTCIPQEMLRTCPSVATLYTRECSTVTHTHTHTHTLLYNDAAVTCLTAGIATIRWLGAGKSGHKGIFGSCNISCFVEHVTVVKNTYMYM